MNTSQRRWFFIVFALVMIVLVVPLTRAEPIPIGTVNCHENTPLLWSPNGAWIAFSGWTESGTGIYWLDIANYRLNPLAVNQASAGVLSWSPNSAYLAYYTLTSASEGEIYVADVTAGTTSHVTGDVPVETIDYVLMAQNWSAIVFTSDRYSASDIYVWTTDGRTTRITSDNAQEVPLALSPDGVWLVFSRYNESGLFLANLSTGSVTQVASGFQPAIQPAWRPGSAQFLYARTNGDIMLVNPDTGSQTEIADSTSFTVFHGWAPDGSRALFTGGSDLYSLRASNGLIYRLTNSAVPEIAPRWLADNRSVIYTSAADGDDDVLVARVASSTITNLSNNSLKDARFDVSPDGTRVIFGNLQPGRYDSDYYIVGTGGGTQRKFLGYGGPINMAWSPNGQQVAACLSGGTVLTTTIQILNVS